MCRSRSSLASVTAYVDVLMGKLFQVSYDYFPLDVLLKYMLDRKRRAEVAVASTMQLLEIFVRAAARFPSRTTTQEWLMGSITGGRR